MLKSAAVITAAGGMTVWAYMRHIMLARGPPRLNWAPGVFGHRGCRFVPGVPENTVPAMRYAATQCATGVECDVRLCKSGELVVFHDAYLAPTLAVHDGDTKKNVADFTLAELRDMRFACEEEPVTSVATLDEVIESCKEQNLRLLIELKLVPGKRAEARAMIRAILDAYERHEEFLYEHAMVISFNPSLLYQLRQQDPSIAVILLAKRDIASSLVADPVDRVPWWFRVAPAVADKLIHFTMTSIAPWIIGVSGVGMPYDEFKDTTLLLWLHRGIFVYVWGLPDPDTASAAFRANGVCVAVDGEHGQFFAKPRFPLRT